MNLEFNKQTPIYSLIVLLVFFGNICLAENDKFGFTFKPHGEYLLLQQIEPDTTMGWIYSATVVPEIAGGKGHSIRFGVAYQNRAGYDPSQSITFFDPIYIDSWQILAWHYRMQKYGTVYMYVRRVCMHIIDMHNSGATFWTHSAFGYGNIAPLEKYEMIMSDPRRRFINYYLSAGPFNHGGFGGLFGNDRNWQWENSLYTSLVQRINKNLSLLLDVSLDHLMLLPDAEDRHRWRGTITLSLANSRKKGQILLYVERHLHDDYPLRNLPVGTRIGLKYSY